VATITVEIKGLDKLLRKSDGRYLLGGPLRDAFEAVGLTIEGAAKERAPVDRGQLRAGIGHQVDRGIVPQWVEIGTRNIPYARPVHDGRRPGSMPPVQAIAAWVARKGIDADPFVIARAIGRHGTKPRPFLTDALAAERPKVQGFFDQAAKAIEDKWQA
jgi:hypothetical protein